MLFELDALAVRGPGPLRGAARAVGRVWFATVEQALTALGVPSRSRKTLARVVGAAIIGLVLDELVSGDSAAAGRDLGMLDAVVDGHRSA